MATTTSGINTNGLTVGSDGKVSFSGINSNIDWQSIIDAQIKADSQPVVNLQTKITANTDKITAYSDLKTKVAAVTTALDKLRGNSGLTSTNVFQLRTATGDTVVKAGAPAGTTASDISTLITANVANNTAVGDHTITIKQLAAAQQIRSDTQASTTAQLGLAGTFTLNGKTITLTASDTMLDVKSKINASGAGVSASIVSASGSSNYLVLTSSTSGVANQMDFSGGNSITDTLGFTAAGAVKTELRPAADAILDVDGITNIHRDTNSVDDVLSGITLSLQKAEPNTEITLSIQADLSSIKGAISDFVDAYNDLRSFATTQKTATDLNKDGTVDPSEVGPLAFDSTMRNVIAQLGLLAVSSVDTNEDGFQSLGQIGVVIGSDYNLQVDDTVLDGKLLSSDVGQLQNLFAFQGSTGDSRLSITSHTSDTTPGTYYVNVAGTDVDGNILSANIQTASGVNIAGNDDGSIQINGNTLTVLTGPAKGMTFLFSAGPNAGPTSNIPVTISSGLADQFYGYFSTTSANTTGTLDTLSSQLTDQNTNNQSHIDTINARLDVEKKTLTSKYTAMEAALAQLDQLKSTISSFADSLNSSSS